MSDTTRTKLEEALTAHISDEAGRPLLITGYILGTAVLVEEWASGVEYVIDDTGEDG